MKPPAFSCRIGLVVVSLFFAVWAGAAMRAAVLTADASAAPAVPAPLDLGQGANRAPGGRTLTADGWSFLLDGRRFIPVSGEFHFSRYPREEWRDELLKMKAGGINIVSTYVFWNLHEPQPGKFEFSGDAIGTPVHHEVCSYAPSQLSEMWTWFLWFAVTEPRSSIFRQPSSG